MTSKEDIKLGINLQKLVNQIHRAKGFDNLKDGTVLKTVYDFLKKTNLGFKINEIEAISLYLSSRYMNGNLSSTFLNEIYRKEINHPMSYMFNLIKTITFWDRLNNIAKACILYELTARIRKSTIEKYSKLIKNAVK